MGENSKIKWTDAEKMCDPMAGNMRLYSVCPECDWNPHPYDGDRTFGDLDKCPGCGQLMDVWTESGVRNEEVRQGSYGARQK